MPYGYMSNSEIVQEMWRGSGRALWVCWLGFSLVGSILHLEDSPDSGTFKRRIPVDTARTAEVYPLEVPGHIDERPVPTNKHSSKKKLLMEKDRVYFFSN